jgi:hypothetical protein
MAFTQQSPIGTPNVNLITKTLAGLQPDSALQEYAALHKNNVYILSLAKAESDRRKEMRLAAQGNPGQQPTVVDQDIAAMAPAPVVAQTRLPENQGIGQLPAPNIARMADGGIAGFDESTNAPITTKRLDSMGNTGGMFNYAQDGGGVMRMAGGGMPKYSGKAESLVRTTDGGKSWWLDVPSASRGKPSAAASLANMKFSSKQEAIAAFDALENTGTVPDSAGMGMGMPTGVGMPAGTDTSKLTQPAYTPPVAAPSAPPMPEGAAGEKPAPGVPSLKVSGTPMNTGLGDLNTIMGDARNRYLRNANSTIQEAPALEDIVAQRQALMPKGKAFEETEASIKKEEGAEPAEKEKAGLMALTQGFLAVAAGESPYALTNIAKGLGLGLKEYGDSLKEFKKAGKERQKQMAEIEQARRAEARGDVDKASSLYESAQDREQRRRASIDQGLASLEAHGISGAASLMGHEISGKYSLAGHQVSANAQKEWMKELKGGQLVETAMKDLRAQIAKDDKYGTPEDKEAAFQKMWPQVLQMNPGLAKYAGSTGGGAAVDTTGFKVLR